MKYTFFFATPADIAPALARFDADTPLKFVALGSFTTPNIPAYLKASEIPDPGRATHETGSQSQGYLVSLRDARSILDTWRTRDGEQRWKVHNGANEDTVCLNLAGLWKTGTLLPGCMSTLHKTPIAQQLMKSFRTTLKQEGFIRIGDWWLGKEALAMLKAGHRLSTTAEQLPPDFDLKLPAEKF